MNTLEDILSAGTVFKSPLVDEMPVLLIDSDGICYRAAAATDGREYIVGKKSFKYKADAEKYCEKKNVDVSEIHSDWNPEPLSHALRIVKNAVSRILSEAQGRYGSDFNMEFFHTCERNFRYDILENYKGNRDGNRSPAHLKPCKGYVAKKHHEFSDPDLEADDLIGIRAYELLSKGIEYVVVSNDKDLKTIPGNNLDWVTGTWSESSEAEAMKFFYAQTIAGDDTDNIPGVFGMGINNKGTGKAQKIIQSAYEDAMETNGDIPISELEPMLYEVSLNAWLEGGPGKKGSYGCKSLLDIEEEYKRTAQCVFILHEKGKLWQPPIGGHCNYERLQQ